ncbi:MAG: S-methyl-5-thioribose-1-phosphate isomerase [Bacteroidota bacterium]|nr:S-methyl-5-thioribose-1-phosphate isomerase [Bacteroidota bacterium]
MNIGEKHYRTIWLKPDHPTVVQVIDQRLLPHQLVIMDLETWEDAETAIKDMVVRGAPLIGITAAYGLYLAALHGPKNPEEFNLHIMKVAERLMDTRPTAINLQWAIIRILDTLRHGTSPEAKTKLALETANLLAEEDIEVCRQIGEHGLRLLEEIAAKKAGEPVQILTHCNAGWLGCVDWGTATAPIYMAHQKGLPVHVWVDETRPRNQGFNLTAWELYQRGVPHTVIVDNTGGHLMQHNKVDIVFVGTDRTTRQGDVANKIGTYLKALAAKDNDVPFYVAVPSSSIDWNMADGIKEIPIEERDENEVKFIQGWYDGKMQTVQLAPNESKAANYGFDVTPSRLITGLITEKGICQANETGLRKLFPDKGSHHAHQVQDGDGTE